ncbi:MAG: hypothetical protein WBQ25_25680 [Nitrososphaeraceae archaeon]
MTKWLLQVVKALTLYTLKGQESSGHEQPETVDNVEENNNRSWYFILLNILMRKTHLPYLLMVYL